MLAQMVTNSRFFIVDPSNIPNLASRVMKLNLQQLGSDRELLYHHAVLIAETFMECSGWIARIEASKTDCISGWTSLPEKTAAESGTETRR